MSTPPYGLDDAALLAQCRQQMITGSGPGGQHRNRTASAVRLTHAASGLEVRAEEHRSRARNLSAALVRLRLRLAIAAGSTVVLGPPGLNARAWAVSVRSAHYPEAVAGALGALHHHHGSLPAAASALGLSSSRLVRLLTADKEVHAAANALRAQFGCGAVHA